MYRRVRQKHEIRTAKDSVFKKISVLKANDATFPMPGASEGFGTYLAKISL